MRLFDGISMLIIHVNNVTMDTGIYEHGDFVTLLIYFYILYFGLLIFCMSIQVISPSHMDYQGPNSCEHSIAMVNLWKIQNIVVMYFIS